MGGRKDWTGNGLTAPAGECFTQNKQSRNRKTEQGFRNLPVAAQIGFIDKNVQFLPVCGLEKFMESFAKIYPENSCTPIPMTVGCPDP